MPTDPKEKQRGELERQAKGSGIVAEWAKRQLDRLFGAPVASPGGKPKPEEPAPAPIPPAKPTRAGQMGNCHDCGTPLDKRNQRTPFHLTPERSKIIYTCRECAGKRWNAIHNPK